MKQQPLFSMTTAYKHMLDFCRIDNSVYALMAYMVDYVVKVRGRGNKISDLAVGIEKYRFPNSKYCELGEGLFGKVMDYENFLCQEVVSNKEVRNLSKSWIDAFNIKYKKQSHASWWKRFSANCKMDNINMEKQVVMQPYENHHILCVSEIYSSDLFGFGIENTRPVFKSAYQQSSKDVMYVYELELVKAIDMPNVYLGRACINVSLFNDIDTANQYLAQSVIEQQNFAKRKEYQELQDKCMPSIMRFDMYANSKNMSR